MSVDLFAAIELRSSCAIFSAMSIATDFFRLGCRRPIRPLTALFCLGLMTQLAALEDDYRCNYILGDWTGVYESDGLSFPEDSYRYDSAYDEDGSLIIDFQFLNGDEEDRHEGFWTCEEGVLTTGLINSWGETLLFQYRIVEISQDAWTYELISPWPNAPVFHAKRAPARAMSPEIFDRLLDNRAD